MAIQARSKTVAEATEMLGVCKDTIYRLLKNGELERAPSKAQDKRGRPLTMVTVSSIINYIKNH